MADIDDSPFDDRGVGNLSKASNLSSAASSCSIWTSPGLSLAEGFEAMVLSLVIVATIGGNTLVLLAVGINKHLLSSTTLLVANLAVADFFMGLFVFPLSAVWTVTDLWYFGSLVCSMWASVDVLCSTASILSLCAISIDRYVGVTRPLQHARLMTHRRSAFLIMMVWALSAIISAVPALGWNASLSPLTANETSECSCSVNDDPGYVFLSVSISFYIPLTIIVGLYYRIYVEALRQSRFLVSGVKRAKLRLDGCKGSHLVTLRVHTGNLNSHNSNFGATSHTAAGRNSRDVPKDMKRQLASRLAKFNREKKAAKTLGIVVGVFFLCWFPFFVILPVQAMCANCRISKPLFKFVFWLGYFNSLCNPIIYACSNREFQWAFKRILRCRYCCPSYASRSSNSMCTCPPHMIDRPTVSLQPSANHYHPGILNCKAAAKTPRRPSQHSSSFSSRESLEETKEHMASLRMEQLTHLRPEAARVIETANNE